MIFTAEHKEKIRAKLKIETRRDWTMPRVKVDGKCKGNYPVKLNYYELNKDCDTWIKVKKVYLQALGEMTEKNAWNEGGYTLEYFKTNVWEKASGVPWDDNFFVYVVEFEYIDKCLRCNSGICSCDDPPVPHCDQSTCGWSVRTYAYTS